MWEKKNEADRFLNARRGDSSHFLFQCEFCWHINITGKPPSEFRTSDCELMSYFRRVNLDMFWSKEPSTVAGSLSAYKHARRNMVLKGMPPEIVLQGPYPIGDPYGMAIAVSILVQSQRPGKNSKSYTQYDSVRKIRSGFSNLFAASPVMNKGFSGTDDTYKIKSSNGVRFDYLYGKTESQFFSWFMLGMKKRMGRLVNQDMGMSMDLLLAILKLYDLELEDDLDPDRVRTIIVCGAAFVILFAGALRGNEVLYVERSELIKWRQTGRTNNGDTAHVVVPLMGRFKAETGTRNFMMALANESASGLEIGRWVHLLSALLEMEGFSKSIGPAICNADGSLVTAQELNAELHDMLLEVQANRPELIASSIDVKFKYSINRSFRRGATTKARENGVSESTISINNRWRQVERSGGSIPNFKMFDLYTEISQTLDSRLRFSKSL